MTTYIFGPWVASNGTDPIENAMRLGSPRGRSRPTQAGY